MQILKRKSDMAFFKLLLSGSLIFSIAMAYDTESLFAISDNMIMPRHYNIKFIPFIKQGFFYAECNITINILNPTINISFFAENLGIIDVMLINNTYNSKANKEKINKYYPTTYLYNTETHIASAHFAHELSSGHYILNINFVGIIANNVGGFRVFHINESDYLHEENVWKLCQDVATRHPSELQHCHVVFVSNSRRSVPLWRQRAGKDEDKLVVWDYHAILIYAPDERAVVYDLESSLPFPTHFWKYATETFRSDEALRPEYHRRFRLVPASVYLQQFASTRHHMKRKDGTWIKTPPDYPPISTPTCKDNLDSFINMETGTGLGVVMSLKQLVNRFYRPNVNTQAPTPPQPQATAT